MEARGGFLPSVNGPCLSPSPGKVHYDVLWPQKPLGSREPHPFFLLWHLGRPVWTPRAGQECQLCGLVEEAGNRAGAAGPDAEPGPPAVVRSGLVGCVGRKCSQVGLQRLLGMSPARQPEARYITREAGTSHLPAPQLSVSAPPARPEASCIPPTTHSPTPGLQLRVERRVSLPAGDPGCGPSRTVAWCGGGGVVAAGWNGNQPAPGREAVPSVGQAGTCRRGDTAGPGLGGTDPSLQSEPF